MADYVLTGTDIGLPARLREADRAGLAAIDATTRAPFYLAMDRLDRADDPVLVRLGRLLAAIPQRGSRAPAGVPSSIWALLTDAT
ncbi:MAG: hypothetical protein ABUL47_00460, partial [Leifsonia sp.]